MAKERNGKPLTVLADGHPRRMADGKNAFRKMSRAQRAEYAAWLHMEGLTEALQDAGYLGSEDNEVGCLDFYTVPPASDPYRPTAPID